MKRIILMAMLCLQAIIMSADVLKGRVVDADSNEPLPDAIVEIWMFPLGENWAQMDKLNADSMGVFTCEVDFMAKVNLTVNYFGYNELKKSLNVAGGTSGNGHKADTLNLGDLKLKMSEELMKEVMVKGHAKRFFMKGDTVVFNPDAFHLEDGDRVAALLKKLPGVSVKDGKLSFMGKDVHLMVNGKDIADEMLTAQLPVEAVQNIEAYERKSELAELSGMDDGQEQQVLNIVVKPGFMDRWYGPTKLSAYASPHYRAPAKLHYLTEKDPLNFFARVSDNGSQTYGVYGENDYEYGNSPMRQQYGKFSYQHNWKPKKVESSYNQDHWSISTSPQHKDGHQDTWVNEETFLSGQPSSFSNSHSYNYNHSLDVPLSFSTQVHLGPRTSFYMSFDGGYSKGENRTSDEQQTYRGDKYAANPQQLTNIRKSEGLNRTENGALSTYMNLRHVWENSDIYFRLSVDYSHEKGNSSNHAEYDYRELGTSETIDQETQSHSNFLQSIFDTKYNFQIVPKKVKAGVGYWVDYWHKAEENDNQRNGIFDFANSFDRTKSYLVNEPRAEVEADLGKVWMHAAVKLQNVFEDFAYQRGKLDTVMHRNTWFPRPGFDFKWKTTKTSELKVNANWDYTVADMLESSAYVDDTNPLYITMGNPNLRPSSTLNSSLAYNMMFMKGQQMLSMNVNYRRTFDPTTRVSAYNAKTGAYASTTTNVADNDRWNANIEYERSLGEMFGMSNHLSYTHARTHGMKTQAYDGNAPLLSQLSGDVYCQTSNDFRESLDVFFENKTWEVRAYGSITYSKLTYNAPSLSGQQLWNYNTGLSGNYKLKHWTFNLSGELVGNRGYLSDAMNRDRFALNADITWKFLKNKAQLKLSARDILNQMDSNSATVTPTQIVENMRETFHRYLALTFTYNFDAKAKKAANK
ncbi:MAG: outer membrane beta-barrel family protein [Bacteroidaceae bacterium]|nr:outer membrane beta-barrel family protein [Bacteroidaceae bacterium]